MPQLPEIVGRRWRVALEIKNTKDNVIRGIGQRTKGLASGCQSAALVTSKVVKPVILHDRVASHEVDSCLREFRARERKTGQVAAEVQPSHLTAGRSQLSKACIEL
jgi:hypothetical protein